jgi:geranylgeranyl diphosphate synthase type II
MEYLEMIRLKTAVLLGFSLELGAMIGGAEEQTSNRLYEFGISIGLGFQLKDDLLDVYADKAKFGKQVGGDIISNKKTYLLIKAMELAKGKQKEDLFNWIKQKNFDPIEKVNAVIGVYNTLGIKELSERKMNDYFDKGLAILDDLAVDTSKKQPLKKLVLNLINREN